MRLTPSLARRLALAWTLGILAACSIPGQELPGVEIVAFDKLVHLAFFLGFGGLWLRALKAWPRRRWIVAGSGLAFAIGTEVYQHVLPLGRSGDPYDVAANVLGLGLALAVHTAWQAFASPEETAATRAEQQL